MNELPEAFENVVPEIVVEPKCLPILEKYKIRIDYQNGKIFLDMDSTYTTLDLVGKGENQKVTIIYKNDCVVFIEIKEKTGDIIIFEIDKGLLSPTTGVHLKKEDGNSV
jgi:c-di-GMP-binding flagellar brake protein YcgR